MSTPILPAEALAQHVAVLGKTGSGKTFAAKGEVEKLLRALRQVCVIDPTGAWWGLRSSADGKAAGYPVLVLGGEHGDMPLPASGGAAVARLITEQRVSAVLDTSGFTVGERSRWFTDFAIALYRTIRSPMHLIIDEAHNFMPQGKVPDPAAGQMLHAGNQLMSGGRSRGIRGWLITQRPAKLHKDSLTCADTLIAMRVIAPQDREAIEDWILGCGNKADGKAVLDSLASLERGEGWVWFPEGKVLKRVKFPPIQTFDSSATPADGKSVAAPKRVAEIDLGEIRKSIEQAIKEAEANDPKALRRRIEELQRELKAKPTAVTPDAAAVARQIERAVSDRDKHWQKELDSIKRRQTSLGKLPGLLRDAAATIEGNVAAMNGQALAVAVPNRYTTPRLVDLGTIPKPAPAPRPSSNGHAATAGDPELSKMARAFLTVLAQRGTMSKGTLLLRAGYASSGPVSKCFAELVANGYMTSDVGEVGITVAGEHALGEFEPPPTGEELRERTLRELSQMEANLLRGWFDCYPEAKSKGDILQVANYASSGPVSKAFAKLNGRGFIVKQGKQYKASDQFFS